MRRRILETPWGRVEFVELSATVAVKPDPGPCPLCDDASEVGGRRCPVCSPMRVTRVTGPASGEWRTATADDIIRDLRVSTAELRRELRPQPERTPTMPPLPYDFAGPRAATLAERGALHLAARHLEATPHEPLPPGVEFAAELLGDRNFLPGPEFAWDNARGPKGRWVLLETVSHVNRDHLEELEREVVRHRPNDGARLIPRATELLATYRENLAPNHSFRFASLSVPAGEALALALRDAKVREDKYRRRANELSDQAGDLATRLRTKRVECDELRDEVYRLRAKLAEVSK